MRMDAQKNKNIAIIGAGIAGLTAGALLSKKGHTVTIFEKQPILGGRAASIPGTNLTLESYQRFLKDNKCFLAFSNPPITKVFEKKLLDGYRLDLGYHAIGGGVFSNLNSVLSQFQDHIDILESYVGFINDTTASFPFLSKKDKLLILPNILRLLLASEKTLNKLDDISITQTIQKYGKGKMKLILEVFSRSITTVNNLNRISTGEMFRAQRNLYKGSKPVGYPKNGLSSIHEMLAEIIKKYGGQIYLNTQVEHLLIDDATVKGIQVPGKRYSFDIVVSSVLLQELFTIADESWFPESYKNTLKSLTGTGSLCAYYALKDCPLDLIGKTFHFLERDVGVDGNDAVGMIDFMSAAPSAAISPKGEYLVQSYIICTPEEAKNKHHLNTLRKLLDKNLKILIPNYGENLIFALYPSVWHLDGVAKTIDNAKPLIHTPIKHLYVIGDGVKAMGIGFNCALNSARMLVEHIL